MQAINYVKLFENTCCFASFIITDYAFNCSFRFRQLLCKLTGLTRFSKTIALYDFRLNNFFLLLRRNSNLTLNSVIIYFLTKIIPNVERTVKGVEKYTMTTLFTTNKIYFIQKTEMTEVWKIPIHCGLRTIEVYQHNYI